MLENNTKGNNSCVSMAKLNYFILLVATFSLTTIKEGSNFDVSSSSSSDLRFLNGHLPVSSVFDLSIQLLILHVSIYVCTQFHHLFFGRPLSRLP